MTADNEVRVERRFRELYEKNPAITLEEVKANLEMRDYIDSNREVSPPAPRRRRHSAGQYQPQHAPAVRHCHAMG